ncbi:MAG: sugar phosphate isomerase/epimerase family protein [Chloroflexota bacterium]|nr:sugar phosphate isomerase/epimerase family protein [Chloroflexota bacterium]
MKIAIQESLITGRDAAERFDRAASFGFEGIEVGWRNLAERVVELKRASRNSGLPISTICSGSPHDPLALYPQERGERLDRMVELLELADELGAVGSICVPIRRSLSFPDLSPAFSTRELISKLAAEMLAQAVHRTEGLKALVLLEPLNRYEAHYLCTLSDGVELAQMVDHPRVKVMADFFHMNIEEADIETSILAAGDWIRHVHLADSNRMLPGQGHTDFEAGFAALEEIGFQGFMALECGVLGDPEVELPRSVKFMRSLIA